MRMGLNKFFIKYKAFSAIARKELLTYPANLVGRVIIHIFRILALGFIYSYLYSKDIDNLPIDLTETVWSLSLVQIIYQSGYSTYKNLRNTIHSGNIETNLNKPYSMLTSINFSAFGDTPIRMAIFSITTVLTLIPVWGLPNFSHIHILFILVSIPLGVFLNMLIEQFIALFTFWIENPDPIYWILTKATWLISGTFIPLALLPTLFKEIGTYIPLSVPFYVGRVFEIQQSSDLFTAIIILLFWIIMLTTINYTFYKKSLKKVSINGG